MNNLIIILVFILVLVSMFMTFPTRGEKATKCLVLLMKNSPITKICKALVALLKKWH